MQDDKKFSIFLSLIDIIEEKIDYGDMSNKNVQDIKKHIENINLRVIKLALSKNH